MPLSAADCRYDFEKTAPLVRAVFLFLSNFIVGDSGFNIDEEKDSTHVT